MISHLLRIVTGNCRTSSKERVRGQITVRRVPHFDIEVVEAFEQVVKERPDGDLDLAGEMEFQRALDDIAGAGGSKLNIDMFGCDVRQCRSAEPSRVHRGVLQVGTIPRTLSGPATERS